MSGFQGYDFSLDDASLGWGSRLEAFDQEGFEFLSQFSCSQSRVCSYPLSGLTVDSAGLPSKIDSDKKPV